MLDRAVKGVVISAATIEEYDLRNGSYPPGLAEAIQISSSDVVTIDPWGHAYNYSTEAPFSTNAKQPYYVWSLGRDNRVGGQGIDQDRGNWN